MEHYLAITLAQEGFPKITESFFNDNNIEWIRNVLSSRNLLTAIKETPLDDENNQELVQFFREIPVKYFLMKLRSNILRGNFQSAKLRMDFTTKSRALDHVNELSFVMQIQTTDGDKTVRISLSMIEKLIEELRKASREMMIASTANIVMAKPADK